MQDKMGRTSLYSYSQDGLTMIETTSPGATLVTRKAPLVLQLAHLLEKI